MLNKHARWIFAEPMSRLANWLYTAGISPNAVTCLGFFLTIVSAFIIASGHFVWGGLLLWFAALFDMLDGTLARLSQPSTFGAFLDSTLDRYSESATLLALAYYYLTQTDARVEPVLVFFILVGSLMVSYTRARAEGLNVECKVGVLQRPERVALVIVGLLTGWMLPLLWILAVLCNITALQRIYEVYLRTNRAQLGLPPRDITLVRGASSRTKHFDIPLAASARWFAVDVRIDGPYCLSRGKGRRPHEVQPLANHGP